MSDYYPNGRPKWDDQFRETKAERIERERRKLAKRLAGRAPVTCGEFQDAGIPMLDEGNQRHWSNPNAAGDPDTSDGVDQPLTAQPHSPSPGMVPEEAHGTGAPIDFHAGAVRPPYPRREHD